MCIDLEVLAGPYFELFSCFSFAHSCAYSSTSSSTTSSSSGSSLLSSSSSSMRTHYNFIHNFVKFFLVNNKDFR